MKKVIAPTLVGLQFTLAAVLVLTTRALPLGAVSLALVIVGTSVAVWAWLSMGLRRIRVMPQPGDDRRLVASGPYAKIRHPMYSGLALFSAGLVVADPRPWRIGLWVGLAAVLIAKGRIEERLLNRHLPAYADYRRRTWRFIPWLY